MYRCVWYGLNSGKSTGISQSGIRRVKTFDNLTEAELDVTFAFLPDGEGMAGLLGVFFLVHSPRGVV